MKLWLLVLFILNIVVALINYCTDDLLRAIWYFGFAIIILICNLTSEVAENE